VCVIYKPREGEGPGLIPLYALFQIIQIQIERCILPINLMFYKLMEIVENRT